jgi:DNA-binding PadR family transcriptional regulator
MYELFLLGKLMERPWHGYEFQRVLSSVLGPVRQVSWGTIYPLLRRMEKVGLIEAVANGATTKGRRGRQNYAITPLGKERFFELMTAEQPNDADYRDTFRIKIGNFSRVEPDVRRAIVRRYLELLGSISAHAEAMSKRVAKLPEVTDPDRDCILLSLAHDRFLADSDRDWVQRQMAHFLSDSRVLTTT